MRRAIRCTTAALAVALLTGCGSTAPPAPNAGDDAARLLDAALAEAETVSSGLRRWILERAKDGAETLDTLDRAGRAVEIRLARALADLHQHARAAAGARTGVLIFDRGEWRAPRDGERLDDRVVLLVHGLDEPGDIWDDLAPALADAGHAVVRFEYPNDQRIAASADLLAAALHGLKNRGVERASIVAHSMGGLAARDVLTRDEYYNGDAAPADGSLPAVPALVLCGTPNDGSPVASLRLIAEVREHALRFARTGDPADLAGFLADGAGQAARDLETGSAFLRDLNSRPRPRNVAITCVVAEMAPNERNNLDDLFESDFAQRWLGGAGEDAAGVVRALTREIGDGVVPAASARLEGAAIVRVHANHRSMLRLLPGEGVLAAITGEPLAPPPAIRAVLDSLER